MSGLICVQVWLKVLLELLQTALALLLMKLILGRGNLIRVAFLFKEIQGSINNYDERNYLSSISSGETPISFNMSFPFSVRFPPPKMIINHRKYVYCRRAAC